MEGRGQVWYVRANGGFVKDAQKAARRSVEREKEATTTDEVITNIKTR